MVTQAKAVADLNTAAAFSQRCSYELRRVYKRQHRDDVRSGTRRAGG
jgi:hypothetical protein